MLSRQFLSVCAVLLCICLADLLTKGTNAQIPRTRFTCRGRGSGYYADVETGCQVYHMCDEIGRQFTYSCPNTTLFQQRMLICDHWYMVDCRKSEQDYDANLLIDQWYIIHHGDQWFTRNHKRLPKFKPLMSNKDQSAYGQRDKPFVSDAEMQLRTPRPDILAVPPNSNYYDGLKEAESKYPVHPGNSIVGIPDTISKNNNGLDHDKNQYHPPTGWSSGTENKRPTTNNGQYQTPTSNTPTDEFPDNLTGAASQKPIPSFETAPDNTGFTSNTQTKNVPSNQPLTAPDRELSPPLLPTTTTTEAPSDGEDLLDIRMKTSREDSVVDFIKRFDPNSPDSHKTAMTTSEILNINQQLPQGQDVSGEEERTPRKQKNNGNNVNTLHIGENKGVTQQTRFNSVNTKNENFSPSFEEQNIQQQSGGPARNLLPPKTEYSSFVTTTVGPPIYYNWKWAVPAFDLEPPKISNDTRNVSDVPQARSVPHGRNPFADWSTTTTETPVKTLNTEYNISSYFVPDYQFPLDKHHPGYDDEDAQTSFNVRVDKPGKSSFGENPACPQCHPGYVVPGTCEPCIVQR